ncbi:3-hydroxyacyl-[acyl-carrier-protein] dehydratase FabZ [Planctomycetes bacterium Poly30]|uniref:3-hydroxyacyl-[acyl-carrier-protein] dehydratase FabZ n=1 Tax=Saltatorellus ferox TaxID=2528018 RepID=A0A518EUD2_9BACT|nr:3-hydroxyacyl-[acyl-carrier-protein] dehydratase FabZ [Planctomycetes bacterium Poly30]
MAPHETGSIVGRPVTDFIPHRPPFLFVTRVVEHEGDRLVAEWDVPTDLPAFEGHFPGEPVLPGVLISEFCFQAGAVLIYATSQEDKEAEGVPVLTRIEDARFRKIVRPGETLRAEVQLTERLSNARYVTAKVTSAGQNVVRLKCVLAVAPPPAAEPAEGNA